MPVGAGDTVKDTLRLFVGCDTDFVSEGDSVPVRVVESESEEDPLAVNTVAVISEVKEELTDTDALDVPEGLLLPLLEKDSLREGE